MLKPAKKGLYVGPCWGVILRPGFHKIFNHLDGRCYIGSRSVGHLFADRRDKGGDWSWVNILPTIHGARDGFPDSTAIDGYDRE